MDQEIWQQLISLESREITQKWYFRIHGRELNMRRAGEINAAAKQAREYFRNADNSNYSVRPLLTYYGVASLSRAIILLFKRKSGEESISNGHGLTTINWKEQLCYDTTKDISSLMNLKIQTTSGLFSDLIKETNNRILMHIQSSAVDWAINYDIPDSGVQISLGDLFARVPDLFKDYSNISSEIKYSNVNELTFSKKNGFKAKTRNELFEAFEVHFQKIGYTIEKQGEWSILISSAETFSNSIPLFVHSYINKLFSSIPTLYLSEPFNGKICYSQLGITYLVSYFLGMLARYFPTQWISLMQGGKGDMLWPTIVRAQQYVESTYPELIIEMINDSFKTIEI